MTIAPPRPPVPAHVEPEEVRLHAADMAVVASADVTLGQLQAQLATVEPHPQWLPIDGDEDATLRELVEHDSTGPLRLGYGGWRDRLTGVQLLDGDGQRITAGGLPVKNVAGYDLVRFAVGGHGCFGRVETITVRTALRPEAGLTVELPIEQGQLTTTVNRLLVSNAPPQWMLCRAGLLRCGWLGDDADLDALAPAIRAIAGVAATRQSLAQDAALRRVALAPVRAWVPPSGIEGLLRGADRPGSDPAASDWAFGETDGERRVCGTQNALPASTPDSTSTSSLGRTSTSSPDSTSTSTPITSPTSAKNPLSTSTLDPSSTSNLEPLSASTSNPSPPSLSDPTNAQSLAAGSGPDPHPDLWADPIHGIVYLPHLPDDCDTILNAGGHVTAVEGHVVRVCSPHAPSPLLSPLLAALKARFDPDAKLPALPTYA